MQLHHQSRTTDPDSSYSPSRTHSHTKSPFWHNQPSCHIQEYIDTDHSFRPEIHDLPPTLYPCRDKLDISKQQRFERLIDNQLDKQEDLYKHKLHQEEKEIKRHCTFQPNVSKGQETEDCEEVFGRLYEEGLEKQRQKERAIPEENVNCTFHPQTNGTNILNCEKTNLEPIYVRFKDEIKRELERKAEFRKRVEDENAAKQVPFTINQESERILERKENFNTNVVQRLLSYMKEADYKNRIRVQEQQDRITQQLRQVPEINPVTVELPSQDFIERQEILAEEARQKLELKTQELSKSNCPFKPKVSIISNYLINIQRANENKLEKIDRMYNEYPLIKQENIQRIEEEVYRECTFHPEINSISRQLEASHVHHCCDHPKEVEHPHKPRLNRKSLKMAANKRSGTPSTNSEQKTDRIRMELEYKEMKECTFRPKTLSSIAKSEVTIECVNGFDKFMRNKELRNQQEEQQKEIEEKLFRFQKKYDQRENKMTKVEEFKLSKSNKDARDLLVEESKRFENNCPFKPNMARKKADQRSAC